MSFFMTLKSLMNMLTQTTFLMGEFGQIIGLRECYRKFHWPKLKIKGHFDYEWKDGK